MTGLGPVDPFELCQAAKRGKNESGGDPFGLCKAKRGKSESGGGDRGGCFASAADLVGLWPRPHNPDQIRAGSSGLGFIFKLAM